MHQVPFFLWAPFKRSATMIYLECCWRRAVPNPNKPPNHDWFWWLFLVQHDQILTHTQLSETKRPFAVYVVQDQTTQKVHSDLGYTLSETEKNSPKSTIEILNLPRFYLLFESFISLIHKVKNSQKSRDSSIIKVISTLPFTAMHLSARINKPCYVKKGRA